MIRTCPRALPSVLRRGAALAASLACAATLAGCAHHYEPMSDWTGFSPGCFNAGFGWIGRSAAATGQEICTRTLGAAGFLDPSGQGSIGLADIHVDHGALRIGVVAPESPSAKAEIAAGDELLTIDGERVRDPLLARKLLFGRAGTPVFLGVRRDLEVRRLLVVRERSPWTGTPQARAELSAPASK